jgi:hypothetical protein
LNNRSTLRIAMVGAEVAVALAFIALSIVYWALPADSCRRGYPDTNCTRIRATDITTRLMDLRRSS